MIIIDHRYGKIRRVPDSRGADVFAYLQMRLNSELECRRPNVDYCHGLLDALDIVQQYVGFTANRDDYKFAGTVVVYSTDATDVVNLTFLVSYNGQDLNLGSFKMDTSILIELIDGVHLRPYKPKHKLDKNL